MRIARLAAFALALLLGATAARADCGPNNPNCVGPTLPFGTFNNQFATTAFVNSASSPMVTIGSTLVTGGAAQYLLYIGGSLHFAMTQYLLAAQMPALTGDCTTPGGSLATSCTKTGGVSFAASATTDATNAANISSGVLPSARLSGAYSGITNTRTTLAANVTYYVNQNTGGTANCNGQTCQAGSDSNSGASISAPWATCAHAMAVLEAIDFRGFTATVQLSDGTYSAGCLATQPFVGGGSAFTGNPPVLIQGNFTTAANVFINTTSGSCVEADNGAVLEVEYIRMQCPYDVNANFGGVVFANNNTTDGSAVAGCSTSLCYHYYANREGLIDISGTNYIQSDGTPAAIYAADHQGNLRVEGPATEMIYQGVITVSIATAYTLGPTGEIVVTGGSGPYTYLDGGTGVGYIAGTTMTLQSVTGGTLFVKGQQLTGGTILGGTTIVSQLSGSAGGAGTYQVNASQTVGSAGSPITITGTSAVSGKCWYADQGYMQWAGGSTSCVSTQNTNQVGFPGSVAGATAGSLPGFHL